MSIWKWLQTNEKSSIFQIIPKTPEDLTDRDIDELPKKYVTLTSIGVSIGGGTDKLLMIRDVTGPVMNEELMEQRREMHKLTDNLMKELQDHTQNTKKKLDDLGALVKNDQTGKNLLDNSYNEVQKMSYRIRDYHQVVNISEMAFKPAIKKMKVRQCMDELKDVIELDVAEKYMVVDLTIDQNVPTYIQGDSMKIK